MKKYIKSIPICLLVVLILTTTGCTKPTLAELFHENLKEAAEVHAENKKIEIEKRSLFENTLPVAELELYNVSSEEYGSLRDKDRIAFKVAEIGSRDIYTLYAIQNTDMYYSGTNVTYAVSDRDYEYITCRINAESINVDGIFYPEGAYDVTVYLTSK